MKTIPLLTAFIVLSLPIPSAHAEVKDKVDFGEQVRPILAEHCYLCHGTDDAKGGLRLNQPESATSLLKSGSRAIIPGDPAASSMIQRLVTTDLDERMPPTEHGDPLPPSKLAILKQWISEGAHYQRHWAYRPLLESPLPEVSQQAWVQSPMDRYVLSGLEDRGISPSPKAERTTLLRRLNLDLTGLPPTPEEQEAFLSDNSREAFERVVDQLLASPHFGERWGRHWLDKARYADSDGYEKDRVRPNAWRYRDWVINAINEDLPIDQFTIEQLAGDLLPEPTEEQLLATAFNRQTLTNTEGGTDQEQWRVAAVMDRTETLGSVWLGLTVGCARCHNHKYDEITQAEYYQLYAFFNNGDESNTKVIRSQEEWEKYLVAKRSFDERRQSLEAKIGQLRSDHLGGFDAWMKSMRRLLVSGKVAERLKPGRVSTTGEATAEITETGSVLVAGKNPDKATTTLYVDSLPGETDQITLHLETDKSLKANGPGRASNGNLVLTGFEIFAGSSFKDALRNRIQIRSATAIYNQKGFPPEDVFDKDNNKSGWAVGGQVGREHQLHLQLGETISPKQQIVIKLHQQYGKNHTLGRFSLSSPYGLPDGMSPIAAQILSSTEALTHSSKERLQEEFLRAVSTDYHSAATELAALGGKEPKSPMMDVRVISQRRKDPRTTHILRRGEFKEPQEQVLPLLPAFLPQPEDKDLGRLDLARWLVNGENPLPPRVLSNQIWANLFGEGLVRSMNDFGVRGDRPTHPGLLDWLARRLIDLKWSRKALIKEIVMSSTYQQSSVHRAELDQLDPQNKWLHRQNRFRLEAEVLRDSALAVSGLLDRRVGGPSVFPLMPSDVAALNYNSSFKWVTSTDGNQHRRGIYTFFKRTAPHPNLTTFDCPDSNVTCIQRNRSNTPLGALTMLNNATFMEAAGALAHRLLASTAGTNSDRVRLAFQLALAREPNAKEIRHLLELFGMSLNYYEAHPEEAAKILYTEHPAKDSMADLAAWTATVRVLLNLDEFITRE